MGALRFPGVGQRLAAAMIAAGYVTRAGKPDVPGFLARYRYDPRMFYPWLNGQRVPELDTLTQLAAALGVSRAWLLLGDGEGPQAARRARRPVVPIAGGSSNDGPLAVSALRDGLSLIGRWWHCLWEAPPRWTPCPAWS